MLAQLYRLLTKDVRYIQKQKNMVWTQHFGFLWIKQYPNRKYHQCSVYIAADTVKKAAWRHQLKRKLLAELEITLPTHHPSEQPFYKLFIFLNKKNVLPTLITGEKENRDQAILVLASKFQKEWLLCRKKLWIIGRR